jgi:hypothetical protein
MPRSSSTNISDSEVWGWISTPAVQAAAAFKISSRNTGASSAVWRAQYFLCRSSAVSSFIYEQHRLSLLNWQRHSRRDVRLLQPAFHQRPLVAASFGASSTEELSGAACAAPGSRMKLQCGVSQL